MLYKDAEIAEIFNIFTLTALNYVPYLASDIQGMDKDKFERQFCAWNFVRKELTNEMIELFYKDDNSFT